MAKKDHTTNGKTATTSARRQSFSLVAPTATRVQLAGDFTDWQQWPLDMVQGADGIWRAIVELMPGRHDYRFLVDGQRIDNAQAALAFATPHGAQIRSLVVGQGKPVGVSP